jgi:hypothetical protein
MAAGRVAECDEYTSAGRLLDADPDDIRRMTIYTEDDIDVAAAPEVGGQQDVNLIEAGKSTLWSGIRNKSVRRADLHGHLAQITPEANARAIERKMNRFTGSAGVD